MTELQHWGVSVPTIRQVARALIKERSKLSRLELLELIDELWLQKIYELRVVTIELLHVRIGSLELFDIPFIERLVRESGTWALIDPLASKVVGPLIHGSRQEQILERWCRDEIVWVRRTVLVSYLEPLRAGDREAFDQFGEYADRMLEDRELFIRKAIGWLLREHAKRNSQQVFDWLLPRKDRASRLTLREASKYLSPAQRLLLLE